MSEDKPAEKKDLLLSERTIAKVVSEIFRKDEAIEDTADDGLEKFAEVRYLDPAQTRFAPTAGGFLSMRVGETETYPRVNLHRAFPFTLDREYISVRYSTATGEGQAKDTEIREAGIIRRIDDFDPENVKLIEAELARRYFVPVIDRIRSIREEFGYTYWDVSTDSGPRRFTAHDLNNNIIPIGPNRVIIIDLDGNRYEIADTRKIDEKNLKYIEMWL